jgi:hypothetical protein
MKFGRVSSHFDSSKRFETSNSRLLNWNSNTNHTNNNGGWRDVKHPPTNLVGVIVQSCMVGAQFVGVENDF